MEEFTNKVKHNRNINILKVWYGTSKSKSINIIENGFTNEENNELYEKGK